MANTTESDEIVEMFCEMCYKKGNFNVTAVGFCVDCVTYFCETCLDYHAQFLPDHNQQDRYQMPKDYYLEKCDQHSKELVKFYCQSCESCACSICKDIFHKECHRVGHLPKLAFHFEEGEEFHFIEESLNSIENEADTSIEMIREISKQNSKDAKAALLEHKRQIVTIFEMFEKEINTHENAFKSDVETDIKNIVRIKKDIQTMKSDIENKKLSAQRCKLFLVTKTAERQVNQLKECMNAAKSYVESLHVPKYEPAGKVLLPADLGKVTISCRENLSQISIQSPETGSSLSPGKQTSQCQSVIASSEKQQSSDNLLNSEQSSTFSTDWIQFDNSSGHTLSKIVNTSFLVQASPQIGRFASRIKQLFTSSLLGPTRQQEPKPKRRVKKHKMEREKNKTKDDNERKDNKKTVNILLFLLVLFIATCARTLEGKGSVSLHFEPKNIGYFTKNHIFIFDTDHFYTLNLTHHQLKQLQFMDSMPSSVTRLSDNMVAMLFPSGKIRVVKVIVSQNETLKLNYIKTLITGKNCIDLVYGQSRLFALCRGNNRIESLDTNGNFLPSWPLHKKILSPSNIVVSPNNTFIYISDTESNAVFRLTMKGIVRASYKHKGLIGPTGMTFDAAGNLYVTGFHSHNVFKINSNLTDGHECFNKSNRLNQPRGIVYDKNEKALYVGSLGDKKIHLLKLG